MPRNPVNIIPTLYTNFGAVTKANIDASNGNVLAFTFTSIANAIVYFQLFNIASIPVAASSTPLFSYPVSQGSSTSCAYLIIDCTHFANNGFNFSTGIGWAVSTTQSSFTDSATASNHSLHLLYQ